MESPIERRGSREELIQEPLGHSTVTLTANTYTHLVPALLRDNADMLDRALRRAR